MLCFVNVHNLHRTAREVVASFQRTTAAEPAPELLPETGAAFYFTTAPESYDGFGTKTIQPNIGKGGNGKQWRKIQIFDRHFDWQNGRNGSGMHATVPAAQFEELRAVFIPEPAPEFLPAVAAIVETKPEPEPVPVPQSTTTAATLDRRRFLADTRQAEKHVGKSIFGSVLLSFDGSRMSLDSTDGDFLLSQTVDYENASGPAAAVVVPIKQLSTLLAKFDSKEVVLSVVCHPVDDSAEVVLSVDGGEFTIPATTAEQVATRFEFFRGPFPAEFATITTAGELCDALSRCRLSTDTESTRYALAGYRFDLAPDRFTIAATDSRRLTVRNLSTTTAGTFPADSPESLGYVFPFSAAERIIEGLKRVPDGSPVAIAAHYQEPHIIPVAEDENGNVTETKRLSNVSSVVVECSDDSGNRFSVRSRVVEGRFPRYQDVIPRTGNLTAAADRKKLLQAITTAAAVLSKEERSLDVSIGNDSGCGEFRGESKENGKSKVRFSWTIQDGTVESAKSADDSEFIIAIDPNYLLDYLKTSTAERVAFRFVDSETAIVIEENDSAAGCFVLMPLSRDR